MVVNSIDPREADRSKKLVRCDADRKPILIAPTIMAHANGAAGAMPAVYGFLRGSQGRCVIFSDGKAGESLEISGHRPITAAGGVKSAYESRVEDLAKAGPHRCARPAGTSGVVRRCKNYQIIGGKLVMKIATLGLIAVSALALGACGNTTDQRIGGAAVGAGTGAVVAGPVGAVVGGTVGAVTAPSVVRETRRNTR